MKLFNCFSILGPRFAVARLGTHWVNPQCLAVTVDIVILKRGNIEKASWGGLGFCVRGATAAGCAGALQGAGYRDRDFVQLAQA